jgi:hypothetical protein
MSDIRRLRIREQAEAHLRQLRTIPRDEALRVMEHLLEELFKLRDVHCSERDYYKQQDDSCNRTDQG